MKFPVRPELPTASVGSSQAPTAAVDNSAPCAIRPESTYKSGKVVQKNGATSPTAIRAPVVAIPTKNAARIQQATHTATVNLVIRRAPSKILTAIRSFRQRHP